MGLLDEAIRDHLDLKRLRGADPAELVRQEREALGASGAARAPNEHDPSDDQGSSTGPRGAHDELEGDEDGALEPPEPVRAEALAGDEVEPAPARAVDPGAGPADLAATGAPDAGVPEHAPEDQPTVEVDLGGIPESDGGANATDV